MQSLIDQVTDQKQLEARGLNQSHACPLSDYIVHRKNKIIICIFIFSLFDVIGAETITESGLSLETCGTFLQSAQNQYEKEAYRRTDVNMKGPEGGCVSVCQQRNLHNQLS